MAVIVLLSVGLGWFGWKLREAERQWKAVEAIRKAGEPSITITNTRRLWVEYLTQSHQRHRKK